ncbi:LysM domain-containing protein [bacterium 1xD42-62]|uniref:LysM domain-containing protein n=1 Tax=Parablautia muri TaxID=2320879 RepID=A0A9X5GTM1_9FIRM|nr:LysM domain-containing protein [Parablautia muri]
MWKICQHTFSTMMQTFHDAPYVHMVKERESLWSIYKKYGAEISAPDSFAYFIEYNCPEHPDLIYPGQMIQFP